MSIAAFLQRRREHQERLRFDAGYDWAAAQLLRGVTLWHEDDIHGVPLTDGSPFDRGINQARHDWRDRAGRRLAWPRGTRDERK